MNSYITNNIVEVLLPYTKDLCFPFFFLQLKYNGKSIPLPFNTTIFKWATGTRQVITNAKLPNGVCFYNIYGTSFETPFDVWYVTKLLLEKTSMSSN